ncbi:MAG TPA: hypothetical protein P5250_07895, partial [Bacteroidales bacterium]|nr:hypothetical protein [Bacteroidales bacterium]
MFIINIIYSQEVKKPIVINAGGKKICDYDANINIVYNNKLSNYDNKNMCDTINMWKYNNVWTVTSYYVGSTPGADGWVNGVNYYDDKAKANYFANSQGYPKVLGVFIAFGHAWSSNPQKTISVNIYSNSGGQPGTIIASKTLTMQKIMSDVNNNYFTKVMFNSPVSISGSFFVGVDFSNLNWAGVYDTLDIQSNTHGETVPSEVWEKQSDGLWYQYNTTYSFPLNISLAIFPIVTDFPAQASFTQSTSNTCPGFNVNFNASASIQNNLQWIFQGGIPSSSSAVTPTVTYNSPGTYTIKLYVWGGSCNNLDSAISQINILPAPIPAATASPPSICKGDTATLTAHDGIYYSWTGYPAGQNPITVSPTATTTYLVNVTGSNGCTASQQITLTVNPLPVLNTTANPPTICVGTSSLISTSPGYVDYLW